MFWFLAILMSALSVLILFLALRSGDKHPSEATQVATHSHFQNQLRELEQVKAGGRLSDAEYESARAELAREVLRLERDQNSEVAKTANDMHGLTRPAIAGLLVAVPAVALGLYALSGQPFLPSQPLLERQDVQNIVEFENALAKIEAQLELTPDDVRGWKAIAPAYMGMERFEDAARAFAKINELETPTADSLTDEAEARLMVNNGHADEAITDLLTRAAALDSRHVRSRFYIAGELTRAEQWPEAVVAWQELLALSDGTDQWIPIAQQGLELALNEGQSATELSAQDMDMIEGMVAGLNERLRAEGGTVDEWTRLVRSLLVLGRADEAREIYALAVAAVPEAEQRVELDALAAEAGLVEN